MSLGVDLGGTNLRAAVVDGAGHISGEHKLKHASHDPSVVADAIARAAKEAIAQARVQPGELTTAGVGVAGMIRKGTGLVVNGPNLGWRDVPIDKLLAQRLPGLAIAVHNDLAVAVWGERTCGAGKGVDDLAMVMVGSGVGCGLVLGGQLHCGGAGVAGEFGHTKVVPDGAPCGCGQRGCLEAYAGGHNLARRAKEALAAGTKSSIASLAGGNEKLTAATLAQAAHEGDALSLRLAEEGGRHLGLALANLVTLLNPARLILGGSVFIGFSQLAAAARAGLDQHSAVAARAALTIVPPQLGDDAGVIGAALLGRLGVVHVPS